MVALKSGLILVLLIFATPIVAVDYVLPEPDHRPSNVAQPCFTGVIVSAKEGYITVAKNATNSANKPLKVIVGKHTSIFTVFGHNSLSH